MRSSCRSAMSMGKKTTALNRVRVRVRIRVRVRVRARARVRVSVRVRVRVRDRVKVKYPNTNPNPNPTPTPNPNPSPNQVSALLADGATVTADPESAHLYLVPYRGDIGPSRRTRKAPTSTWCPTRQP